MSDFYQTGIITTLHQLGKPSLERLELELYQFSRKRPIALVLPALYSEFDGLVMPGIIRELAMVKCLNEIVLALDRASEEEFRRAQELMSPISADVRIIHNNGKRITEIYEMLGRNGLDAGQPGKGRSAGWPMDMYWLAGGQTSLRCMIAIFSLTVENYLPD
jgi:glucosyl-3-phosphoglycerate synthase